MTIRFLQPWGGYQIGARASLAPADETRLINSGLARADYTQDGPVSGVPLLAIPSSGGVTNWDVAGPSIAGHVVYSALPKLNGHLPADGRTYSISAFPDLAKRLGRIANGLSPFSSRASAADNAWRSVCWSAELSLFVAVASTGTGNRVMTSPDGITWTARTSAADNAWRSVCWSPELSLFVAVAESGTGGLVMTAYGCTYNPITDFAVPKLTAPAGCYAHIFAG